MSLTAEVRVGKKRSLVIPKAIAEALDIEEGSKLLLEVKNGCIVLKPIPDAISLSIRGEKFARITLEELEVVSLEEQEKHAGKA